MCKINKHTITIKALVLLISVCLTLCASGCASGGPVTGVTVLSADFQVIKVLSPEEIKLFEQHWERKSMVDVHLRDVGGRHYKLDISHKGSGNRWLYQSTGYVQVLSVQVKHVYKIQDEESFNKLIGATK